MSLEASDKINKTQKMKNSIFAIPAIEPAIPPKPNTAAMIAIIKKVSAIFNIINSPLYTYDIPLM